MSLINKFSCLGPSFSFKLANALRIVGEMVSTAGISKAIQTFFTCNGLDKFNAILKTNEKGLKVETLWVLSNIACDDHDTALKVVRNDIFTTLLEILEFSTDIDLKRESIMVIGNILTCLP